MNLSTKRGALVLAAAGALLVGTAVTAAAVPVGKAGTSVSRVSIVTEATDSTYTSSAFTTVGSTTIAAGAGSHLLARFTAESKCSGGSGWCSVRILVDGIEADPAVGTNYAFDATDDSDDGSYGGHSVERAFTVSSGGTHTVTVQAAIGFGNPDLWLDDWTLSVLSIAP
jgi:hypothetical protein